MTARTRINSWPDWEQNPHRDGEGFDLPPSHFTPGVDLDASAQFAGLVRQSQQVRAGGAQNGGGGQERARGG